MPIYYFHLHECGTVLEDVDGKELANPGAARIVAIRAARDVMAGEVMEGRLCLSCWIVIESGDRAEVDRVSFRDAITLSDSGAA